MPRRCEDVYRNGVKLILGRAGKQLELAYCRSPL